MIRAHKLYADEEGHSRVAHGFIEDRKATDVYEIEFKETPAGSTYDWHTAPFTQYVVCLTGTLEFTTSRGEVFHLRPGEVLIAADTTGKGHKWRMEGDQPWRRVYVRFTDMEQANFIEEFSAESLA